MNTPKGNNTFHVQPSYVTKMNFNEPNYPIANNHFNSISRLSNDHVSNHTNLMMLHPNTASSDMFIGSPLELT